MTKPDNINVCAVPHDNYLMNIPTEGGVLCNLIL